MFGKVGILGGTGFVGNNLCDEFDNQGIEYEAVSRSTGVDARDPIVVYNWITNQNIDVVVNLAAECGGIGKNRAQPADLWLAATRISTGVLEACKISNITRIIQLGTVCSYAKNCPTPFKEDDLMNHGPPEPTNRAYGVAKLNGLYGAQAFAQQYGLSVCNLMAANMYGPYDHFGLENSHVIPAIIRKIVDAMASKQDTVKLWGTGEPTREFLYAGDLADAIILAITKPDLGSEIINIGTGVETSINRLVHDISRLLDYKGQILWDSAQPNGQPRRCLDVSRAREMLGFEAKTDLKVGLETTIEWYFRNPVLEDLLD